MDEPHLTLKPHILLERDAEEDDLVLIDSRTGRMTACNESATVVISALQSGSTVSELIRAMTRQFKVSDDVATRDVNALLDVLAAEGFLDAAE